MLYESVFVDSFLLFVMEEIFSLHHKSMLYRCYFYMKLIYCSCSKNDLTVKYLQFILLNFFVPVGIFLPTGLKCNPKVCHSV